MFGSSANVLHVIPSLTRNPVLIPLWIPDQSHLASSVTSGMTYVPFLWPMSYTSFRAWPGIQFYLYMDPGSKSPRRLGDVRDDVVLEAGVERGTSIDASKEW